MIGQDDFDDDGNNKGLQNICYAPVTYAGSKTELSQCTVQSIFGYFQNSFRVFNETSGPNENNITINYLNTLNKCMT